MTKQKNILAITAHPDDHVTFAGTIFKLKEQGYDYHELILTAGGEGGNYKNYNSKNNNSKVTKIRDRELEKASIIMGTKKIYKFNLEDQNISYNKELMQKIVKVIREIRPDIGITMNLIDIHPDHIAAAQLAREAFRWSAKGTYHPEYGEGHRTPCVLFAEGNLPITPNILVDITEFYDKKYKLFKVYNSQASPMDLELLKSFAIIRGYHLRRKGSKYAESFSVEQNILPILFDYD